MFEILEKGEFNTDFHPVVDFIAASLLRYALTVKPTIFVSHIRQFWSTARIETTYEGTYILATMDGIQRTISESSLRRNLKLRDEDGIVSIPDTELFENLTLMGYNISQNQKFTFQKQGEGSGTPTEPHHTPSPETDTSHPTTSSIPLPSLSTAHIPPAQEVEILRLKERVEILEDRENVAAKQSGDNAPIKGRSINEGEAAAERISNDSKER
nr:hypothetical protein [Tanacetum cinerariifolium]